MDLSEYLLKYPVAFVAVSLGNDPESIATIVTTNVRLPHQKVYLVTFEGEKCKELSKRIGSDKNIEFISYDFLELNELSKVEKSVIAFDNISFLKEFVQIEGREGFKVIEYLKSNDNWVLVFGTQKTNPYELKEFSELYAAHFWNDKFADLGQNIKICLNKTKMTSHQERRYNYSEQYWYETRKIKPNKNVWKKDILPNLKRLCNIVYPTEIQTLIEKASKESKSEIKPPSIDDLIQTYGLPTLLENSPKFQNLLDKVILHRKKRQVIYTSFSNYFGTGIISGLLKAIEIPHLVIDYDQSDDLNKINMKAFNSSDEFKILIINTVFDQEPLNIEKYHIIDSNLPEAYEKIFRIYKYKNYEVDFLNIPSLHIEMYCTSKQNGKSYDDETFDEFYPYVTQQQKFWDSVKESSLNIVPNSSHRLSAII
jgi:hypothetical protein